MDLQSQIKSSAVICETQPSTNEAEVFVMSAVSKAWQKIPTFWPLENLIATNPLHGFEHLPIEQALAEGGLYFQHTELPQPMHEINRESIKWCQAFFDQGQATINMPLRKLGFYQAWRHLAAFDKNLHKNRQDVRNLLKDLPYSADQAILKYIFKFSISAEQVTVFLSLLLTTLPGWASYIKYSSIHDTNNLSVQLLRVELDFLAIRLITTYLLWPQASQLLKAYHKNKIHNRCLKLGEIKQTEKLYHPDLLKVLEHQARKIKCKQQKLNLAQWVFCIDVRSEGMRRAIEACGNYETFGFAGFFGVPIKVIDTHNDKCYSSCPVLLKPKHSISYSIGDSNYPQGKLLKWLISMANRIYQSLKYNMITPFVLVEVLGIWAGLTMLMRNFTPLLPHRLKKIIAGCLDEYVKSRILTEEIGLLNGIALSEQCFYAESFLKTINLVDKFAPLVILCGHGSSTVNNAYGSILDCGACGGHTGAANAKVLAAILNNIQVRQQLNKKGIVIPDKTRFIAGLHNTTTDQIELSNADNSLAIEQLKKDLKIVQQLSAAERCRQFNDIKYPSNSNVVHLVNRRSFDWAQTVPEWGLAGNAAFIIAPRHLTQGLNLQNRIFLHSYCWEKDSNGLILESILTAPMIIAQWINCQYLFSALDNCAYGSGSKITHNVVGKIGIMQGNSSDFMHGLPLQSVFINNKQVYHQPLRLLTIIYAPRSVISKIIYCHPALQNLFGNGWVKLACIEPSNTHCYELQRDFTWIKNNHIKRAD